MDNYDFCGVRVKSEAKGDEKVSERCLIEGFYSKVFRGRLINRTRIVDVKTNLSSFITARLLIKVKRKHENLQHNRAKLGDRRV